MAKKSVIARNKRRQVLVQRYAERRAELKRRARDPSATQQDRWDAQEQLQRQPRDACPARLRPPLSFQRSRQRLLPQVWFGAQPLARGRDER